MKLLKNRFLRKVLAVFFLLLFVTDIVYPTLSYALTTGPHQTEYTSFEDASSTDMVNLLTGDFSYNMPILNVPIGEDGEYSIPLSYHAGIGPEQEASWVGLGWNINVGSLTRNINGFPDDASGEFQRITMKDLNFLRGWSASFLGQNLGWDSQNGHYGMLSIFGLLKAGYDDNGLKSVGAVGLTVSRGGEVSFNGREFAMVVVQAALTILTAGTSSTLTPAMEIAMQVGTGVVMDIALPEITPDAPTAGNWKYAKREDRRLFHTDYWIYLDQTRNEEMYGVLNLQNAPSKLYTKPKSTDPLHILRVNSVNKSVNFFSSFNPDGPSFGAASDINIDLSGNEYWSIANPSMLAYDNYQVNSPGVSGTIKPYRLELGSVGVVREMKNDHFRLNVMPYENYKVPFVYDGTYANRYFHHVGHASAISTPTFYYGLTSSKGTGNEFIYNLDDVIMNPAQRKANYVSTTNKLPQGNHVEWITNAEIKNNAGQFASGFMDYFTANPASLSSGERFKFRKSSLANGYTYFYASSISGDLIFCNSTASIDINEKLDIDVYTSRIELNPNYPYDTLKSTDYMSYKNLTVLSKTASYIKVDRNMASVANPQSSISVTLKAGGKVDHSIGGFVITGQDGMNYHFSLPIYDYEFNMLSEDINDQGKNSTINRFGHFANTWLLTAITGPDFVDRGNANGSGNGIVDDNDWGYWIKFNYGLHLADYTWRMPYSGFKTDSDGKYKSFVVGKKEKYYLNSVETKSHVAVFLKGGRNDAQDALTTSKKNSLRLEEIALLTKDAYKQLITPANGFNLADCNGRIDIVYGSVTGATGSVISSAAQTYIQQNAIRRVVFNTDYSLCTGASNSLFSYGKLTLNSVSVRGKNNMKVFPDYKFEYLNDPDYHQDKWDGWGMYSSQATSSGTSHKASTLDNDGAAWSMTKVTTPLGNRIEVEYERDEYSSISNAISIPETKLQALDNDLSDGVTTLPANSIFTNGERVMVSKTESWYCEGCADSRCIDWESIEKTKTYSVQGTVNGSVVTLDNPLVPIGSIHSCANGPDAEGEIGPAYISRLGNNRKGGNVRVKSIALRDDFNEVVNKSNYLYTQDGLRWSASSGVVSVEPDYIKTTDHDFYKWLGYHASQVMYGKVTVLTGKLLTDGDYYSKQVYEFETPTLANYQMNTSTLSDKKFITGSSGYGDYSTMKHFQISRKLSKVGKLKSVKTYSKDKLHSSQSYVYEENISTDGSNLYQGVFSEGTLFFEIVKRNNTKERHNKGLRTTIIDYPYVLKKIVNIEDGIQTETENMNWDLYTGAVVETQTKSAMGLTFKSIVELAYKSAYPEMGSKAVNPAFKNMLSQTAATYSYKLNNLGNEVGIVSASANIWKKGWEYRKLNTTSNEYEVDALSDVYRMTSTYVFKGDYASLNSDGTQRLSDKFNFNTLSANTKWQIIGSTEKYSHGSAAIETKDINGIYSCKKVGYNDLYTIASASNARFEEVAFSSAEDRLTPTSPYFGGEVKVGTGATALVSAPVHTGKQSLQVPTGGTGFIFKRLPIQETKKYRASVWANSTNGRIYYKINGIESIPIQTISKAVKLVNGTSWYKIDIITPIVASNATLEVGVKTASGTVVFDDFRFHPILSSLTSFVYYPDTKQLMASLDNDNLSTRYEYNDRGFLTKTYRESITFGEKLVSESTDNFRRFNVDQ